MDVNRNIVKRLRENRLLQERKDYESMERNELIKLAQGGDQFALSTLVDTHQDFLKRMTKRYFFDTLDRDDVMQLATIAFWDAIQGWDGSGEFEAYAGMLIKRKMVDELRKEDAEKVKIATKADSLDRVVKKGGSGVNPFEYTLADVTPAKGPSLEEEALGKEGARKLMKFIKEELSDAERTVIMRYIDGYKVSEISQEENMKYKSVENALRRVKEKLSEYMRNVREARQVKLSEDSIFSDEEKQILRSLLNRIEEGNKLREGSNPLESELEDLEVRISELVKEISEVSDSDRYEEILSDLSDIKSKLSRYEDSLSEDEVELFDKCEELYDTVSRAESMYPENLEYEDPYVSVGMRRSDF